MAGRVPFPIYIPHNGSEKSMPKKISEAKLIYLCFILFFSFLRYNRKNYRPLAILRFYNEYAFMLTQRFDANQLLLSRLLYRNPETTGNIAPPGTNATIIDTENPPASIATAPYAVL